ncbi:urease accessory protein UreD [Glaciimonas immobilis]|nr:urease accessory protein UreD [Glaciimonas immobilis]
MPWQARLTLGFANDQGTTRLIERSHVGPLRVQKPLYPEQPAVCHAIIIHPPGGVVGGDQLTISAQVGPAAHALLTTPGAAKWYKANGNISQQKVTLSVAEAAVLEWLPQETIFFNHAVVKLDHNVVLAADASYIGGEILCFGRTASGESFDSGKIMQRTSIRRGGKLIWFEQGTLCGGTTAMNSHLGLANYTVSATLIAVGKVLPAKVLNDLRQISDHLIKGHARIGATQMKSVLVMRFLGHSSELARQWMTQAWQHIRPELLGREAVIPRIWNT